MTERKKRERKKTLQRGIVTFWSDFQKDTKDDWWETPRLATAQVGAFNFCMMQLLLSGSSSRRKAQNCWRWCLLILQIHQEEVKYSPGVANLIFWQTNMKYRIGVNSPAGIDKNAGFNASSHRSHPALRAGPEPRHWPCLLFWCTLNSMHLSGGERYEYLPWYFCAFMSRRLTV